jgi:hypothetical protein
MIYSEIQDLTNAEAVAQYKDITHFPMPIGEVEFFLSQNGLAKRSAITGNWEGVLIDAIASNPDISLLFEHLNGPRNVSVDTTEAQWAILCGNLLASLVAGSVITQEVSDDFINLGGGYKYPSLDEAYVQEIRDEEAQRVADAEAKATEDAARAEFQFKMVRYNELYNIHISPLATDSNADDAAWVAALQAMSDEFVVVE